LDEFGCIHAGMHDGMHDCQSFLFYFAIMKTKRGRHYFKTFNKNKGVVKISANLIFLKLVL
jgi:hypothetical protein